MAKALKKKEITNVEEMVTKKEKAVIADAAPAVDEDNSNDIVIVAEADENIMADEAESTTVADHIDEVIDDVVNAQAAAKKLIKKVLKKVANKKLKIKKAAKKLVKELTKKA
jgi:hypothetical protein